jgi:hypothetical protein
MDEKKLDELMAHLRSQGMNPDRESVRSFISSSKSSDLTHGPEQPRDKTALLGLNALRTLGQGASLGFADEAVGAVRGALSPNLSVSQGIEREREGVSRYKEDHPVMAPALEVAGGIGTGVAASLATGGAALPTLARAVKVGAGLGGAAGVGTSEGGVKERAIGGAKGTVLGAATSYGLGKIGIGVAKATPGPQRKALNQLARRAQSDETSLNAIADEAMPGPNTLGRVSSDKPLIMADYGGENLRGTTRVARTLPGKGKNEIPEMLAERSAGAEERVLDDLLQTTGIKDRTNTFQKAEDIIRERAETSRPLYQAAHSVEVKDDRLRKFFKIPAFQKAYERAARIAQLEGDEVPALEKIIQDGGAVPVKAIDYLKRGLDDLVESGSRGESGMGKAEAGALRKLKNEMLDVTDELVPEFMEARGFYRGESELLEALESGRGLFKMHPDQAAQVLKNPKLSQGERELMKRGMFEALADRIENIPTGNDIARRVGDKTMDQKRLRLLFDDDASFDRFKELLGQEARMHQTKNYITGGSQTADKLAELADLAGVGGFERLADVVGANPMGMVRTGLRALGRKVDQGGNQEVAEHLTPLLTAQGKDIRFGLEGLKATAKKAEEERRKRQLRALPPASAASGLFGGQRSNRREKDR